MGPRQLLVVKSPSSGTNREKRLTRVTVSGLHGILLLEKNCCSFLTGCKNIAKKPHSNTAGEITEVHSLKGRADLETNSFNEKLKNWE